MLTTMRGTQANAKLTGHAKVRMAQRGIASKLINLVLDYGRTVYTRGAVTRAIGRKEVERYWQDIDLSQCEGVQVVCSTCGDVLTVYRNRNFRTLRPGLGRGRFQHR